MIPESRASPLRSTTAPPWPRSSARVLPWSRQAYPTFPSSDKAGFVFEMPSVAAGPHVLVVTIEGKDGGKTDLKRHVQIK